MSEYRDALRRLGVERLVLAIHQVSFPGGPDDLGVGTPYNASGHAFLRFVSSLGFTGVALGPSGVTSLANPSPYDSSLFSTNPMFLDVGDPAVRRTLSGRASSGWNSNSNSNGSSNGSSNANANSNAGVGVGAVRPDRANHTAAWYIAREILAAFRDEARRDAASSKALDAELALFAREAPWLPREATFEGASALYGDDWRMWPANYATDEWAEDVFRVGQWLLFGQHARTREVARDCRLRLYADAQIGISHRDRYLLEDLFLPGYAMGAPPSRTNPVGQPWGYPVLHPELIEQAEGAGQQFLKARVNRLLSMHDGLRIDHVHGWVCPWVYRTDSDSALDPLHAVQNGARLHESPDLPDHPELSRFAYVRGAQLDRDRPRYHDDWVRSLDEAQIARFSSSVDVLMESAGQYGVRNEDLLVEVLSTCPRPLAEVLRSHGLGRFRVTQKANVSDSTDVYRSDNASDIDWVMVGNHDTPPLRLAVERWGDDELARRAAWLARLLLPAGTTPEARQQFLSKLVSDRTAMCEAMLAELFVCPARNVQIFWADLFGLEAQYNRPGSVDPENWTLRVPVEFESALARAITAGHAPSLRRVLALALRARADGAADLALAERLERGGPGDQVRRE
ncbi:MAG: 4-alpha-glucanotransferase [Deltaproteobacteria bacterium]|nr:4-alpha-glucanotransferase [Deltaproteobacteria bacterium]